MSCCPFSNVAWLPCFSTNQYGLNKCCRGSPKEHFKFWYFADFLMPQQPKLYMEFKSLNNFERGPPKKHSCEVWLKLVLWFMMRWSLKLKDNDGQRVIRIDHIESSAQVIIKKKASVLGRDVLSRFVTFSSGCKAFSRGYLRSVCNKLFINSVSGLALYVL